MKYIIKIFYTTTQLRAETEKLRKERPDWVTHGKELVALATFTAEAGEILNQEDEERLVMEAKNQMLLLDDDVVETKVEKAK